MEFEKTDWNFSLRKRLSEAYFKRVEAFIEQSYQEGRVYPSRRKIFWALELTKLAETKVVIVGQDPYPQPGKAQGLAFSYPENFKVERMDSAKNLQKELVAEGFEKRGSDLTGWAKQGVLLLNSVLTVPENQANGHAGKIWEPLTDAIIAIASEDIKPKVFILWGAQAQKKSNLIDSKKHLLIQSAHPSPLSAYRGFFGSNPFSRANNFLTKNDQASIDWSQ